MKNAIIHVDMDAFYASIEQMDNPQYRGKPIAVGGLPDERGVICTASYEARKFGIRSAMSSRKAIQLCSHLIFVPVRMDRYIEVSKQIHKIFEQYSDRIEPISIDEAFLQITNADAIQTGKEIKERIKKEVGLTASVGISINKYLAKLASDYRKPDGFTIIPKKEVKKFLSDLPIRKLLGVGPKTEKELHKLGIYLIRDLQKYDPKILVEKFGNRAYEMINYSKGIDPRPVENRNKRKSIGEENTFLSDIHDIHILKENLYANCKKLTDEIQKHQYLIKTITIKVKYHDFSNATRSITLAHYTDSFEEIYFAAENILLNKVPLIKRVRLLGVQLSNILYPDDPVQLEIKDILGRREPVETISN